MGLDLAYLRPRGARTARARRVGTRLPAYGSRAAGAAALAVLALASIVAAAAPAAAAPAPATAAVRSSSSSSISSAAPARMSDAQLAAEAGRLQAVALRIGSELLGADAAHDQASSDRQAAEAQLGAWAAAAYRDGGQPGSLESVLAGDGIDDMLDRLQVARAVNSYWVDLVTTLDRTEGQLALDPSRRYLLVEQLSSANARASLIDGERLRRAEAARAKYEAARSKQQAKDDAAQAAAAAAAAAQQSALGQLTSFAVPASAAGGYSGPAVPLVSGPLSAAQLDGYLASKGSPMAGQGAAFIMSGSRWQVDPRLLVAIAGAESSFGDITCGPHNAWGWACPNDPADFGTWAAGIETVTRGLRKGYLEEGRTTVALIQQKYCPVGAANDPTGLNGQWLGNVSQFLIELGGNPSNVGPGPGAATMPDIGGIGLGT